jgi:hypothetical protein
MTRLNTVQLITTQSGAAGDLSLVFDSNYDKSAIGCVRECVVIGRQVVEIDSSIPLTLVSPILAKVLDQSLI